MGRDMTGERSRTGRVKKGKQEESVGQRGKAEFYILDKIIGRFENSANDWREETDGNRSIMIQQTDYNAFGKSELVKEARELEQMGLIRVKWFCGGSEIETIAYRLRDMPDIYRTMGKESKKHRLERAGECMESYERRAKTAWLKAYYKELFQEIQRGKYPRDLEKYGELLFRCLDMAEKLREPMFMRVFSSKYLNGSKVFEQVLKPRVVAILKKYHPMVDEAMGEYEILSQIYLENYAQELELKGDLRISLGGRVIDLSAFPYGTVLNSETLKHSEIVPDQRIGRIITVENKANYMSMPYEKGTLILFCHGFFSPREREFLAALEQVLDGQRQEGQDIEYYHTGDLDYGGVRIFRYIRTKIFPLVKPLLMDEAQYEKFLGLGYGTDMETSAWEKLKKMEEPLLQPLIDRIVQEKKVVEQECFLF